MKPIYDLVETDFIFDDIYNFVLVEKEREYCDSLPEEEREIFLNLIWEQQIAFNKMQTAQEKLAEFYDKIGSRPVIAK